MGEARRCLQEITALLPPRVGPIAFLSCVVEARQGCTSGQGKPAVIPRACSRACAAVARHMPRLRPLPQTNAVCLHRPPFADPDASPNGEEGTQAA
jgi:hypothetical protein